MHNIHCSCKLRILAVILLPECVQRPTCIFTPAPWKCGSLNGSAGRHARRRDCSCRGCLQGRRILFPAHLQRGEVGVALQV